MSNFNIFFLTLNVVDLKVDTITLHHSILGLASEAPWKQFLALRGVLQQIADLMTKEIEQLHRLEETTLTSDLAQGKISIRFYLYT